MNWAWVTSSLDHIAHSPSLPMWLALAAAAFFGLIVLVTLLRAEKSVANGALTVITLLAIGVAAAATLRKSETAGQGASSRTAIASSQVNASLPALSCLDDLAGDMVLAGCERVLFGSADSVAAAVSASAAQINRLIAFGDVAAANKSMTPELAGLRRAIERDRYGLIAYVLQSRDRCMPESCAAYAVLTDHKQVASNMEERAYEGLVTRYAPGWNAPPAAAVAATGALAGLPASVPTGKPTTADFPSASSIPPISIMTETPVKPPAAANAQAPVPRAASAAPSPAAAKKQPAPKAAARPQAPAAAAPVQLAPEAPQADN